MLMHRVCPRVLLVCPIKYQYAWVSLIYNIAIMESKLFSFPSKITEEVVLSSECNAVQHKTLVGQNFGEFRTARKLVEKILAADHTNNIVQY